MKYKLKSFSLVEMILTLGILSIVFLMTTKTLNTVVRVSAISRYKTATRNEADFIMELTERLLSNSNIKDIYIYDSSAKSFNGTSFSGGDVAIYDSSLDMGSVGNEIHVQPYNFDSWTCIGYFKDPQFGDNNKAYIVKRSVFGINDDPEGHHSCFQGPGSSDEPYLVLNSDDISVKNFQVSYVESSTENNLFYIDLEMEPLYWAPGESTIEKSIYRQSVITTQGLTWY
jgi:hypothetical protein